MDLRLWWPTANNDELAIVDCVARFVREPLGREFCALHRVGEDYAHRRQAYPTNKMPGWLVEARSLHALSHAYQWPLADWLRVNPGIRDPAARLYDSHPANTERDVRVPDPHFAPLLAGYFAARVLASRALKPAERMALILKLVPITVGNRTALDTVLSRLVLALAPAPLETINSIETVLTEERIPGHFGA